MNPFCPLSTLDQLVTHLRGEILRGALSGTMPGVLQLAAELGTSPNTMVEAVRLLEREGLLESQGPGRRSRIVQNNDLPARPMRVAILLHERADRSLHYLIELQRALTGAGHATIHAAKSLLELGMDLSRIKRLMKQTEADAWVVHAGSSEVLEWFCTQHVPAIALAGRQKGLPIAGVRPDKAPAFAEVVHKLAGLGHRRIVLLSRRMRRLPEPGLSERAFLAAVDAHGMRVGQSNDYNLPDWEESAEGLAHLVRELFRVTPPTALLIDEPVLFVATQQLLARRRIVAPEQVSLICTDQDPTFTWCLPSVAHIYWDPAPLVRRIVRWAGTVSRGGKDIRQTFTPAEFIPGGTIGPVPSINGRNQS